jgi:hypothetical protein
MDISLRTESWTVEDRSWLGSRDGTEFTETITLDTSTFTEATHYPDGYVKSGTVLAKLSNGLYGPYNATDEVQTVTITGSPTGGTFTLTFDGQTTAAIAYNAAASAVQTALVALSNVETGEATVAGGPGPGTAWTVTFSGQYAGTDVPVMTADGTSLTGGTSPEVTVTTTTAGGGEAAAGAGTAAGFLFNSTEMRASGPDVGAPLLWRGVIKVANLPTNHGLDAGARADLAAKFRFKD